MTTDKLITRKFVWDDDQPPIIYRPGTSDEIIIKHNLVERREYMFPNMEPKIVFDMGGNIGVMAVALASIYQNAKIYSFEPVVDNFNLLVENTKHLPNVKALNYGIAKASGRRRIWTSEDATNLGGFSMEKVNQSSLGILMEVRDVCEVFRDFGVPDVVKIDVEGAEAEIFENMPNLSEIKWITGELHGVRDFQILDLLSRSHHIQCSRTFSDVNWHFQALNREWAAHLDQAQR